MLLIQSFTGFAFHGTFCLHKNVSANKTKTNLVNNDKKTQNSEAEDKAEVTFNTENSITFFGILFPNEGSCTMTNIWLVNMIKTFCRALTFLKREYIKTNTYMCKWFAFLEKSQCKVAKTMNRVSALQIKKVKNVYGKIFLKQKQSNCRGMWTSLLQTILIPRSSYHSYVRLSIRSLPLS